MPSSEQSHKLSASGDLPRHLSIPLGLIPTHQGITPQSVETLRVLGHGRAAEARLVRVHLDRGQSLLCVEKVFRPALLTRFIYRAAFQAPFADQSKGHAIQPCYYRRRVAGAIVEASGLRARVAEPLYVRWDAESEAFVLGSEFVHGRGIKPQAMDPSPEADAESAGKLWFNRGAYPKASFVSGRVRSLGNNRYEMRGTLTLKGRSREMLVPVTFTPGKTAAAFDGAFVLKRLDFGIGEGMWADVATVANEVQVRFRIAATGN